MMGPNSRTRLPVFHKTGVFVGCALSLLGCLPQARETNNSVELKTVPSCNPSAPVSELRATALGFGPFSAANVRVFERGQRVLTVDDFPVDTELVAISATAGTDWVGQSVARLQAATSSETILMLPLGQSCPLGDPDARGLRAASQVVSSQGEVLFFGGLEEEVALRRAVRLKRGETITTTISPGMQFRRAFATATVVGQDVFVAGGLSGSVGAALDTFEVFQASTGAFSPERSGLLCGVDPQGTCVGRADHGAAETWDGELLLVGGVAEVGGPLLRSVALIDPKMGRAREIDEAVPVGLRAPNVFRLESGLLVLAGGTLQDGAPFQGALFFDEATSTFVPLLDREQGTALGLGDGTQAAQLIAPLRVGDRFVSIHERDIMLYVQIRESEAFDRIHNKQILPQGFLPSKAVGLMDGALLVLGSRAGVPEGVRVDFGLGISEKSDASRVPTDLLTSANGELVELNADGVSLRRQTAVTYLDPPPTTYLPGDGSGLALDDRNRWQGDSGALRARVDHARLDIPTLQFQSFRIEMEADAGVEVLMTQGDARRTVMTLLEQQASVGSCTLERASGSDRVFVERDGTTLVLSTDDSQQTCLVEDLDGPVSIAIRAFNNASIRLLRIERLGD